MQKNYQMLFDNENLIPRQTRINTQESKTSYHDYQNNQQIMQLNVARFLGLNKLLLDKIVFKRKQQKYYIRKIDNQNKIISDQIYFPPKNFLIDTQILQNNQHSVPVCRIRPIKPKHDSVIIYAHGNASDLIDSLQLMEKLAEQLSIQIVAFDYTGYGCSKISQITEETLKKDLELVIAWVNQSTPLNKIILWGFSLGTFPVCYCASKYKVRGTILQSPLASIGCLFKQNQIDPQTHIQNDHLASLNYIHKIKSQILLMHSKIDKIVPFSHSVALVKKYVKYNGTENIEFLQIGNLQHNQMHAYFLAQDNLLRGQLLEFIKRVQSIITNLPFTSQDQIKHNFFTVESSSSITLSLKASKIKLISQFIYPNSGKKQKKRQLERIRSSFKLSKIPDYNSQQQQLQIENGIIKRKFNNKSTKCYCLQKC